MLTKTFWAFMVFTLTQTGPAGAWSVNRSKDSMTDSEDVYLYVDAADPHEYSFMDRPRLWVRCMNNTTALFVTVEGKMFGGIYGNERALVRIDDEKAFHKNFERSNDFTSFGLWSGGSSIPFIKSLFGKTSLRFRVEPGGQDVTNLTFPISGLEHRITPLREACNW